MTLPSLLAVPSRLHVLALTTLASALGVTYLIPHTADPLGLGSMASAEHVGVQALLAAGVIGSLALGAAAAKRDRRMFKEVIEGRTGDRMRLEGALDTMVMNFAEANRERKRLDQDAGAMAVNLAKVDRERRRLEGALDAMVMCFAEADGERMLLARRATEMIARYDRLGICRYASPASLELLGYEPAELIGTQGVDLVHPDDRRHVRRARSAESDTTFSARLVRKDGGLAPVQATVSPVRCSEGGKLLGLEVSVRLMPEQAEVPVPSPTPKDMEGAPPNGVLISLDQGRGRRERSAPPTRPPAVRRA